MTTHYGFGSAGTARNRANQHTAATERHTMTDPAELLDRLDAAREKATPGPWGKAWENHLVDCDIHPYDAALIVATVNHLPALTSALRAVLAAHTPIEWFEWKGGVEGQIDRDKPLPPFCRECTADEYVDEVEMGDGLDLSTGGLVDYPCPTVSAVVSALAGDHTNQEGATL